jgi:hypothetical protein
MQNSAVLHIAALADAYGVHIAAHYGVHPDGAVVGQDDIAQHLRRRIDVAGGRYSREHPSERPQHIYRVYWRRLYRA